MSCLPPYMISLQHRVPQYKDNARHEQCTTEKYSEVPATESEQAEKCQPPNPNNKVGTSAQWNLRTTTTRSLPGETMHLKTHFSTAAYLLNESSAEKKRYAQHWA